jgi:hypothetical protein
MIIASKLSMFPKPYAIWDSAMYCNYEIIQFIVSFIGMTGKIPDPQSVLDQVF